MEKNASPRGLCGLSFFFFFEVESQQKSGGINFGRIHHALLQGAGPDKELQIRAAKCCHPAGALEGHQGLRGSV